MRMKLFCVVFIFCLLPINGFAAEKFTFVFDPFPPYEYVDNDGKYSGVNIERIKKVCRQAGIEYEFISMPWSRAIYSVKKGDADAIFSLFKTPEREEYLLFPVKALNLEVSVIVVRKNFTKSVKNINDMRGWTIGMIQDYSYGKQFDEATYIIKDPVTRNEQLLKKLKAGRNDVIIMNQLVYQSLITDLNMQNDFKIIFTVNVENLYVAFSRVKGSKAQWLADQFSKYLP